MTKAEMVNSAINQYGTELSQGFSVITLGAIRIQHQSN
jgi:hypothetical protein